MTRAARGFTLIEIAIAMFMIGALLAAALTPLRVHSELRARRSTIATMDTALEALYGYASMHGRLPCPDSDGDGYEDRRGTRACVAREGALPYVELGVTDTDAWGQRLRYRLTAVLEEATRAANFAAIDDGVCAGADADFDLCERGDIVVNTRGVVAPAGEAHAKTAQVLADAVPAVLVSHGANGHGALLAGASARALPPPTHGDEMENLDDDNEFHARNYSAPQAGCSDDHDPRTPLCEFDDVVRWVSPTVLAHRMISAGRLP